MAITLYGIEGSAPVRAVLLTAKALGVAVELKPVDLTKGEHLTPEFKKMNPAHSIPTMNDGGYIIWESRAILTYLINRYGKDEKLYPKDAKARGSIDNMLFFDGTTLYAAIGAYIYPMILAGKPEDPEKKAALEEKISILDTILSRHTFAAGSQFTVADISLLCSLTIPETAGFPVAKYPNIVKWQGKVKAEMPFYDEVTAKGLKELESFLKKK